MVLVNGQLPECDSEVEIVHVGDSTTHPVTKRRQKRTPKYRISRISCIFEDIAVYIPHVNSAEIRVNPARSEIFDPRA